MPKHRPGRNRHTVEGRRAVLEALRSSSRLERILIQEDIEHGPQITLIVEGARDRQVPVETVGRRALDRESNTNKHQGVIALAPDPDYVALDRLLLDATGGQQPALLVVLDGVEDPQNLGAIARSVDGAGGHGMVIPERRAAGVSPGAIRASAGALQHVPVSRVVNLSRAIDEIKAAGVWIVGLESGVGQTYTGVDMTGPIAIVIGSEGDGMSRVVREKCDFFASLPQKGQVESLNASVTAGIMLYEAVRQRSAGVGDADRTADSPE
ncbi:MAG: 23S rRNA (guanosine(2251)-2'-O)-methyltransferase RlmB [Chloroflexi bacterium]|nr:23S rRNA (guanosine(2251)-2'-O)-methyltransferase RlmB [Chloroflexota bacterium]